MMGRHLCCCHCVASSSLAVTALFSEKKTLELFPSDMLVLVTLSANQGSRGPAYRRTGIFWFPGTVPANFGGVPAREIAFSRFFFHFSAVPEGFWLLVTGAHFFLLHVASKPEAKLQVHHNTHSQSLYTGRGFLLQCIHRCIGVV
jgi:hypothetical protein